MDEREANTTLSDEEIETRRLNGSVQAAAAADDSDETGDVSDTGDDSGDPADVSDTGDDSGDPGSPGA